MCWGGKTKIIIFSWKSAKIGAMLWNISDAFLILIFNVELTACKALEKTNTKLNFLRRQSNCLNYFSSGFLCNNFQILGPNIGNKLRSNIKRAETAASVIDSLKKNSLLKEIQLLPSLLVLMINDYFLLTYSIVIMSLRQPL